MAVSAEDLPEVTNPKHPDHAEDRLTRAAAAKLIGATRSTIRRLEVAGALHPTIDAAGVHRFDPAEVVCVARDRAARPVDSSKEGERDARVFDAGVGYTGRMSDRDERAVTAANVFAVVQLLDEHDLPVWLDGGWGVDALLGEQARPHGDLDIAVRHGDVLALLDLLSLRGYEERPRDGANAWNFVMADRLGHEIDVRSFTLDDAGNHIVGIAYPAGSLTGTGTVNGEPVRCIAVEFVVRFRSAYEPRERDYQDVFALHERFGVALPEVYARQYHQR